MLTFTSLRGIVSKRQNYHLWREGEFGNKLRAWRTLEEWRDSGFVGMVVLRTVKAGNGPCRYNLFPNEVEPIVREWIASGDVIHEQIVLNEAAPDHDMILQGEYLNDIYVVDGTAGWGYFYYSRAKAQMRDALKNSPEIAQRLRADLLLRLAMTPSSHEDWEGLIERYPGHVLEVSIYDHCLGDLPGRNSLVWEVRKY